MRLVFLGTSAAQPTPERGLTCICLVNEKTYTINSCEADHSVISYSYLFQEKDKPGRFFPDKAKELGVPEGELWHKLQTGQDIQVGDKIVKSSDVLGEKRPGKRIGISGDTRPTKKLEEFFKDCDYLSFDSTFSHELQDKALETYHSTAKE